MSDTNREITDAIEFVALAANDQIHGVNQDAVLEHLNMDELEERYMAIINRRDEIIRKLIAAMALPAP